MNLKEEILPLKERDKLIDRWLFQRLEKILPNIMREHQLDMWIVIAREYNEDPVLTSLFPSSIDSSRRLTIFVFSLTNNGLERMVIHPNPSFEPFYKRVWNTKSENQWECLSRIVQEKNPKIIGLNTSSTYAMSDGLTHSYYKQLEEALGENHAKNLVSAEQVVIGWLSQRCEDELVIYPYIVEIARKIAAEALSNSVIHPGITTTTDVVHWIRQRVLDLGLQTSFYPTVDIQRCGESEDRLEQTIILLGDIVHLDFGIQYLGLATDTQLLAYVKKIGEHDAPVGLKNAMKTANCLEDIIAENFQANRTGNEVLMLSLQQAKAENIQAMIYSHPIDYYCHGIGPLIGLYDKQEEIPVRGELLIRNNTCYAMEFNIRQYIPEWEQEIPIYMEETITFINGKVEYLTKRQMEFYLI